MTLTYSLTEEDYLQSQLFIASKSDRIKKKRRQSWLIMSGCFFLLSIAFYNRTDNMPTVYFVIIGIVTMLFYPRYERNHYKRHYQKYIADVYKNRFNEIANITFADDAIESVDRTGSSKINLTELETISETGSYFYLKLKTGPHLIIPKAQLQNRSEVRTLFTTISNKLNINFISDLNWRWK